MVGEGPDVPLSQDGGSGPPGGSMRLFALPRATRCGTLERPFIGGVQTRS